MTRGTILHAGRGATAACLLLVACPALAQAPPATAPAAPTSTQAPPTHAHRHRLIGLAAKAVMMHASVLHHESGPGLTLDRDLARQNAEEIPRLARSQIANLLALEREPGGGEPVAREVADMAALAGRARGEADSLLAALGGRAPDAARVRRRAQRLFHLERRLLQLHVAAEAVLGVRPPPDPPEPVEAGGRR